MNKDFNKGMNKDFSKDFNKVQAGLFGQEEAERFLVSKGMITLQANFRSKAGEIDLVMKDGMYIVFVEVKYRRSLSHGLPGESIDARKQQRIKKAAMFYIARYRLDEQDFRFDAVEIFQNRLDELTINHIENAFW